MISKTTKQYGLNFFLLYDNSGKYSFSARANVMDTTKCALRYFNAFGKIEAMFSNGWSVQNGTIVEPPADRPYKYIIQFSEE